MNTSRTAFVTGLFIAAAIAAAIAGGGLAYKTGHDHARDVAAFDRAPFKRHAVFLERIVSEQRDLIEQLEYIAALSDCSGHVEAARDAMWMGEQ